ncbi:MAG: hypothetical protein JWR39_846 [Devosia sp.]|jgi:chromosomal replication initiation ATPase DnaA|nr:hypothetical protein [Devosia sp.]
MPMLSEDEDLPAAGPQLALDLGHTPSHDLEDFLVGEGNELAHGRIMSFPHWADPVTLLVGPAKSGKSHLARIFAERSGAVFAGVHDLAPLAAEGGRQPVIVEDVDSLAYDESGLFHLLNQSLRDSRPLLLTAREGVAHWPLTTDDVRSRARRAAAFSLELTDDIQLSQMLVKLFGDRQIGIEPKVISFIVARMERSAAEAVTLVELMDRLALAKGTAITRSVAAEVLDWRLAAQDAGSDEQDWGGHDDE